MLHVVAFPCPLWVFFFKSHLFLPPFSSSISLIFFPLSFLPSSCFLSLFCSSLFQGASETAVNIHQKGFN